MAAPQYTIEPMDGGYLVSNGEEDPVQYEEGWFPTIKEAAIAVCQAEYSRLRREMHSRINVPDLGNLE